MVIPCADNARAVVHLTEDVRLGSLTRFPLMPTAEHSTWGLSWQCFPVALWSPSGVWGFFQWETVENGRRHSHPAREMVRFGIHTDSREAWDLRIVDARGRLVNRFASHGLAMVWDRTDYRGTRVGSGLYFGILHTAQGNAVKKIVME